MLSGAHVEIGPCLLVEGCDWSGMHWHWGERRFRSLHDLMESERLAFDRVLRADQQRAGIVQGARLLATAGASVRDLTTEPAGRRQPPERSTMPTMKQAEEQLYPHGRPEGMAGYSGNPQAATTEEEANERAQLTEAMQWLGLLHVDVEHLVHRTAERPLGQTIDDLVSIEISAEHLERIAQGLRTLRMHLRDVAGQHLDTHDRVRDERRQKEQAAANAPVAGWDR